MPKKLGKTPARMLSDTICSGRPMPPAELAVPMVERPQVPAEGLDTWVRENLLTEDAPLYNPDHAHLEYADIGYMWAASGYARKGNMVIGLCEEMLFRCHAWQKERAG